MTPKELYEWAKDRRLEDASIRADLTEGLGEFTFIYPEIKNVSMGQYEVVIDIN